ncbi:MAG: ABC transporter substrate-binding protein [Proteobacteria bacterium]|nr:ABC transporter substrate-binding protein [Pseudomonadota bacterium]MCH9758947.1 ABC transporter substrate-binding protein [Pseudomonadota bacterium]
MPYLNMQRRLYALLLSLVLVMPVSAAEPEELAKDLVEKSNAMITQLVTLKQQNELTSQSALAVIQKNISPSLDFNRMTQRAMGKHWKKTDEAIRNDIAVAFQALLENTYAKVLAQYSGQKVKLLKSNTIAGGKKVSVLLQVYGGSKVAELDYIFEQNGNNDHRVTDIKVEGVSLTANYRRQFAAVLRKTGAAGLAAKLQQMASKKL